MRPYFRRRIWLTPILSTIRRVLPFRDRDASDFALELESHLELLTAEHLERGMARDEAERAARIRLGGVAQLKEINRELRGWRLLETFLQDVRYAARTMRRNPGFSLVAVLTLALGIGANTAIFSVVRAVVLKPLPYAEPEQLFNVFQQRLQDETAQTGWSYQNFEQLRRQNHVFSAMAGSQFHQLTLTGHGEPSVVNTSVVTSEMFTLLGEKPLAGRILRPEDGKAGAQPVAVLSEALWRRAFGGDPAIVGSSIDLDKRSFAVVGIMPATFRFPVGGDGDELWIPLAQDPLFGSWMPRRGGHWLQSDRPPEARRHDGGGGSRAHGARHAPRERSSRREQRLDDWHDPAAAVGRRQREAGVIRAARRRCARAVDRVRQPGEPPSRARDVAGAGDRRSHDARRPARCDSFVSCSPRRPFSG